MLDFFIYGIFWVLALYGLFEVIKNIIYICTYTKLKSDGIYMIIAAKNQEEKIECFLRSILFRLIYGKEEYVKNIIVTDLDSVDDTMKILNRLSTEYECVKPIQWKDCKELMDSIDKS